MAMQYMISLSMEISCNANGFFDKLPFQMLIVSFFFFCFLSRRQITGRVNTIKVLPGASDK